jgi:RND family efflux transporter MFP subunit
MNKSLTRSLVPLLGLALLTACAPPKAPPPPTPKVSVVQPHLGAVTNWDEYPAHIEAVEMVDIRPRVAGFIESIHFEDGAEVKAGDLLFVIDPKPFQAALDRAAAERDRAAAHLERVKNELKRAETVRGTKAISEEEYDSRSKAVLEADAALAGVKAAEAAARLNLDYTQVKAPIKGRIGRRLVTAGNLVQGSDMMPGTLLATLVSVDPVYCAFDVDEAAFLGYRGNGSAYTVKKSSFFCDLALVGETGFPHRGRVDFFDNQVDAKSGTIRVRATLENADRALVPGMFAKVRLPAGPPYQALLLPAVAVSSDQGNKFVLVVNKDGLVEPRPIKVDRQHGALRAVTEGLTTNDRVIVTGLMMARPGAKVEVVEPPAQPAPPLKQAQR